MDMEDLITLLLYMEDPGPEVTICSMCSAKLRKCSAGKGNACTWQPLCSGL